MKPQSPYTSISFYLFTISIVFLTLFRAKYAFNVAGFDEQCYYEWLYRFLHIPAQKCWTTGYFPGAALAWFPFAKIGEIISQITSTSTADWVLSTGAFGSFAAWAISLFVVQRIFCRWHECNPQSETPLVKPLVYVLAVPVLGYATQHTYVTHAPEWLSCTMVILFLIEKRPFAALIAVAWAVLIRPNNLPLVALVLGSALDNRGQWMSIGRTQRRLLMGLVSLLCIGATLKLFQLLFLGGYSYIKGSSVLHHLNLLGIWNTLSRRDYGLLWFAPWWLCILGFGIQNVHKLSWTSRAVLLWMFSNFAYICAHTEWAGLEYSIQLRYIIGSAAGALVVLFELSQLLPRRIRKCFAALVILSAFTSSANVWLGGSLFSHNDLTLAAIIKMSTYQPVIISPIPFAIMSWLPAEWIPSPMIPYKHQLLSGPARSVMTVLTIGFSATFSILAYSLFRRRKQDLASDSHPSDIATSDALN